MDSNPYSPPKAQVEDQEEQRPGERPRSVTIAMAMLWTNLVISVIGMLTNYGGLNVGGRSGAAQTGGQVFGFLISAWLYYRIGEGRNWARITLLVLAVIFIPIGLYGLFLIASYAPMLAVVSFLQSMVTVAALVLLFGPGRAWFRKAY